MKVINSKLIFRALLLIPIVYLIIYYTLMIYVYHKLGYIPSYGTPSRSSLEISIMIPIAIILMSFSVFYFILLMPVSIYYMTRKNIDYKGIILSIITFIFLYGTKQKKF